MMAVRNAYGDSRTYYQTDVGLGQYDNQMAEYNSGIANSSYAALLNSSYQSVAHVRPDPGPTNQRVITDKGFGGAESRPRMRRYRRPF